ncbi:C6 transcription factor, putative [Talaromyces stipitatus ATCC 10500]|uniref:C6 transcription factor, putative n=1 Tax=Talaromyces stipitatus (strain ATCC 10500 / CBS 375.48 / QM 6759 / NRRL 1006) TaxID=441959 RepID=B8MC90_TALSN|nr:C6 transcription factor, putative [Talaromyces stipitatus ATCC 10500]EED18536.1 C6 transcription factor, putative [Talaromyces stipitatus ATCC 10500]
MNPFNDSAARRVRPSRSSLACLPCRSRHLKCDGKKPYCSRCVETAKQCHYVPSRRGGLDRAALAERRKRLPPTGSAAVIGLQLPAGVQQDHSSGSVDVDFPTDRQLLGGNTIDEGTSLAVIQVDTDNIDGDALIEAYYRYFHKFHPFVVPQKHLTRLYQDMRRQASWKILVDVLRLVGHIFISGELSIPLKDHVKACLTQTSPVDAIIVQCRLLYSMILFWHGHEDDAKIEIDTAIQIAVDLQMFLQAFAWEHGGADPVVRENLRRTWWMLYIVDTYYAGTLGMTASRLWDIESTVELPCEESDYESGEVPEPISLQEFDCREFAPDSVRFSSFTYLIGAVRCTALAISMAPKSLVKEDSADVVQSVDSILDGWLRLLPKNSNKVMDKSGNIDELMFQAHLVIHITSISLHRPFSDLKFDIVEKLSSCAREPLSGTLAPEPVNIHTLRVLQSVEAQTRLLVLPFRQFHHSPFVTCMISGGALALLSACKFLLKGKDLMVARGQMKMIIGCLKELSEVWPRTARNLTEIQTIARHVLELETRTTSSGDTTSESNELPCLADGGGRDGRSPRTETTVSETGHFSSLSSIEGLCTWFNFDDFSLDRLEE